MKEWFNKMSDFSYDNLLRELEMPSQMDYKLCFKMFCSTFSELLEMVMPLIPTEDTIMRECYSTSETK